MPPLVNPKHPGLKPPYRQTIWVGAHLHPPSWFPVKCSKGAGSRAPCGCVPFLENLQHATEFPFWFPFWFSFWFSFQTTRKGYPRKRNTQIRHHTSKLLWPSKTLAFRALMTPSPQNQGGSKQLRRKPSFLMQNPSPSQTWTKRSKVPTCVPRAGVPYCSNVSGVRR